MIGTDHTEILRRFGFHPMQGNQKFLYETNRAMFIVVAEFIARLGPSRESSLALTALQEALMWTNAHIACNNIDADDEDVNEDVKAS